MDQRRNGIPSEPARSDEARAAVAGTVPATRTLWLEIEPMSRPVTGRVGDGCGRWTFTGWLELAAALHDAMAAGAGPAWPGDPGDRSASVPPAHPEDPA